MSLQVRPPEETLIQLSDGDWILVKKWLTAGEDNKIKERMVKTIKAGETGADGQSRAEVDYDIIQLGGFSQVVEYLIDWSAKDPDGKPIVIRDKPRYVLEAGLNAIPPEAYQEIVKAISAHVAQMDEELTARKNALATGNASPTTSPSVAS